MLNLLRKKRGEKPLPVLIEGSLARNPDAQYPSELDMEKPYDENTPVTMSDFIAFKSEILEILAKKPH